MATVMPGLVADQIGDDPGIHPRSENLAKTVDCRPKPGNQAQARQ
jgi:hypothetical protein